MGRCRLQKKTWIGLSLAVLTGCALGALYLTTRKSCPCITLSAKDVDFGRLARGESKDAKVEIRNDGNKVRFNFHSF